MRLNIYNIYPTCYLNFKEIYKDLDRIKEMGFEAIWLSSILETGFKNKSYAITGKQHYYLLNLADLKTTLSKEKNEVAIQWVQKITKKAMEFGLTPMFDLMLNYVFLESDVGNKDLDKKIFPNFWKEKIDWFIDTLGFRGVQIDSMICIETDILELIVTYIATKLKDEYKIDVPVVLGEVVGDMLRPQATFPIAKMLVTMKEYGTVIPFDYLLDSANELKTLDYSSGNVDNVIETAGFSFDSIMLASASGNNEIVKGFLA